jgi:integrase/recombinase XerD
MNIYTAIADFLLAQSANGNSRQTVNWYNSILSAFGTHTGAVDLKTITATDCRLYLIALRERDERYTAADQRPAVAGPLSDATIAGHTRALHAFWRWVAREYTIANPMSNVKYPAQPRNQLPKVVAWEDFQRLFAAAGATLTPQRDRAILAMLMDTGCRVGGLAALTVDAVNLPAHIAYVVEKGGNLRFVPFTPLTAMLVQEWLTARGSLSCKALFTSFQTTGKIALPVDAGITVGGIQQLMARLKRKAGVSGHANPHAFRHAFAKEYIKAGGDLATLSRLLGHTSVSVTSANYLIFDQKELVEAHTTYSPFARLEVKNS